MAGDWIKMDHSTPDKPEIWRMAAVLKVAPEQAVGHLVRVWVWADQQCVNVNVDGSEDAYVDAELSTIDAVARLPGFAQAMQSVGWIVYTEGRITFPHLQSYISETAKIRALRNRRQGRYRANAQRREEKFLPPKSPASGEFSAQRARKPRTPKVKTNGNGVAPRGPMSDDAVMALGVRLGVQARAGESMDAFRARVLAEDRKRHGEH